MIDDDVRDIPGFPGYGVTSDGVVCSKKKTGPPSANRNHWKTLKSKKVGKVSTYLMVCLTVNYKQNWRMVHRLVYESWVGPIPPNMCIDHIDGNRFNNSVLNLEAVTPSENNRRAVKLGLWGSKVGDLNPNSRARRKAREAA